MGKVSDLWKSVEITIDVLFGDLLALPNGFKPELFVGIIQLDYEKVLINQLLRQLRQMLVGSEVEPFKIVCGFSAEGRGFPKREFVHELLDAIDLKPCDGTAYRCAEEQPSQKQLSQDFSVNEPTCGQCRFRILSDVIDLRCFIHGDA
ncbi:hypothetical protein [Methylococcus sp. EFPC2]|uniref:hypothetical protein n=1 Tax=Methylococcus sp. EFPC2 TaxID=2812648 RepID=UPI001F082F58|nr:hypothetical protein [Methylococcus sp. EFPC2]